MDTETFEKINSPDEGENLERKRWVRKADLSELNGYITAIANEGGGHFLMGVADDGTIVGTSALSTMNDLSKLRSNVFQNSKFSRKLTVKAEELTIEGKRVVVIQIPARRRGEPISYDGQFFMRKGDALVGMDAQQLKGILEEYDADFSNEPCDSLKLDDIDDDAIEAVRERWSRKTGIEEIKHYDKTRTLKDLGLYTGEALNYAALIILGTKEALDRYLPQSETIWEYRTDGDNVEAQQRRNYREPFILYFDRLWGDIDSRNDLLQVQDGFTVNTFKAFNEEAIREAVLNGIAHRDYREQGSVFIRQSPSGITITSPGSFPAGVTAENIVDTTVPRNRKIAEVFEHIGFVERSGQGADKIFRSTIKEGKGLPDYSRTDEYRVQLKLDARIIDREFLKYLERIEKEKHLHLSVDHYILLEKIRREIPVDKASVHIKKLLEEKLIEGVGRGAGYHFILAKHYYSATNKRGEYTRQRGLDSETKKALILQHLKNHKRGYIADIEAALSHGVKRATINYYLRTLRNEGKVEFIGNRKSTRGANRGYWSLTRPGKSSKE